MSNSAATVGGSGNVGVASLTVSIDVPAPGVLVTMVCGELDLATAPHLDLALRKALDRRPRCLFVDLSRVEFLGLQGTAVVERLRRRAAADGVQLGLVGLSEVGERALRFAGVLERLVRYPNLAAALRATTDRRTPPGGGHPSLAARAGPRGAGER